MQKETKQKIIFLALSLALFINFALMIELCPFAKIAVDGNPIHIMDGRYFYNYTFVMDTYSKLGIVGIKLYTNFHILDYFFLISYMLLMMSLTLLVIPKQLKRYAFIIPIFPALFDIIENTLIEIASASFPTINVGLAKAISIMTPIKWGLGVVWFIIFLILLVNKIISVIKLKKAVNIG
ncbi:MAG: hypothetical protein WCR54_01470 [Clostridia bacterium]